MGFFWPKKLGNSLSPARNGGFFINMNAALAIETKRAEPFISSSWSVVWGVGVTLGTVALAMGVLRGAMEMGYLAKTMTVTETGVEFGWMVVLPQVVTEMLNQTQSVVSVILDITGKLIQQALPVQDFSRIGR